VHHDPSPSQPLAAYQPIGGCTEYRPDVVVCLGNIVLKTEMSRTASTTLFNGIIEVCVLALVSTAAETDLKQRRLKLRNTAEQALV
jgi:hypothetical protein